ncbi:MAG: AAA family ATPase [Myxococcota bacterium]
MSEGRQRDDVPAREESILAFEDFELHEATRTLVRGGDVVALTARPFALLAFLCRNRHRFVAKDELIDHVWSDVAVSDASLFTAVREVRRALGDSASHSRFIQTRRRDGYRFVADVAVLERRVENDFVGRRDVLAALVADAHRAADGHGGIVLVAGEPGIGKSRLVEEFAAGQRDVSRAWCWEGDGAPPYWPWIRLLRALCDDPRDAPLRDSIAGSPLAVLLTEWTTDAPPIEGHERPDARFRLFDAVRDLLARAAAARPRVLVIEDLHWADTSTLHLLEFVAHEAARERWLLVGTYRDAEAAPPHPLAETLGRVSRNAGVRVEPLGGLDEASVARLWSRWTGATPDVSQLRDTCARTGGNPLWIRALCGLAAEDASPSGRVHAPVREVLEALARRLAPRTRAVLERAAVLGVEVSLARLAVVCETDERDLDPALRDAQRRGFVVPCAPGRIRFVHALIQESLVANLSHAESAALHARAAHALVAFHRTRAGPHLSEIADHFCRAAAHGEARNAADYSRRACEWALGRLAYDEAAAHARRAGAALEHLGGGHERERCDLLLAEADALARGGRLAESIVASRRAGEIARTHDDGLRLARAAVGSVGRLLPMGVLDADEVDLLGEALRRLGDRSPAMRAELLLRLSAHASAAGDPATSAARLADGAQLAFECGDARVQALALRTQAYNQAGGVDPLARIDAATQAFERAEASGDPETAAMSLFLRVTGSLVRGDLEAADRDARELERRIERQRLLEVEPFLLGHRATRLVMQGRYAEAEPLAIETARAGERIRSPVGSTYFGVPQLADIRRAQGRAAELAGPFAEAANRFPDQVAFLGPVALLLADAGERERARALLRRAAQMGFDRLPVDANRLALIAMFAEAAASLGDVEPVAPLYEMALPHADLYAVAGHAQAFLGPVSFSLGLLAGHAGRDESADAHLADALERAERLDSPPLVARTCWRWAQVLARRSRVDRARVEALLHRAAATAEPIGMQLVLDGVRRERERLAAR